MRSNAVIVALATFTLGWWSSPHAHADDTHDDSSTGEVNPTAGGFGVAGETATGNDQDGGNSATAVVAETAPGLPPGHWVQTVACDTQSASGCVDPFTCPDGSEPVVWTYILDTGGTGGSYSQCPEDPEPTAETTPPVDIPAEVRKQFERVDLPASTIAIQPPGGKTLVNLPTILSTTAAPFTTTVRLDKVGVAVTLDITPASFHWHHGDGTTQTTDHPGGPYAVGSDTADPLCTAADETIPCLTHVYAKATRGLTVSVDTTWTATYQVNGAGPWQPVQGSVTIAGDGQRLAVLEAAPQLVR